MKKKKISPVIFAGLNTEVRIEHIINLFEDVFDIDFDTLKDKTHFRNLVDLRAAFVNVVLNHTKINISLNKLGNLLNRSHSTIIHYRDNLLEVKNVPITILKNTHKILEHMGYLRINLEKVKNGNDFDYNFTYHLNGEETKISEFDNFTKISIKNMENRMKLLKINSSVIKL